MAPWGAAGDTWKTHHHLDQKKILETTRCYFHASCVSPPSAVCYPRDSPEDAFPPSCAPKTRSPLGIPGRQTRLERVLRMSTSLQGHRPRSRTIVPEHDSKDDATPRNNGRLCQEAVKIKVFLTGSAAKPPTGNTPDVCRITSGMIRHRETFHDIKSICRRCISASACKIATETDLAFRVTAWGHDRRHRCCQLWTASVSFFHALHWCGEAHRQSPCGHCSC